MKTIKETEKVQTVHGEVEKTTEREVPVYTDCYICSESVEEDDATSLSVQWHTSQHLIKGMTTYVDRSVTVCPLCLNDLNEEKTRKVTNRGATYKVVKCSSCGQEHKSKGDDITPIPKGISRSPYKYWFCKPCAKELFNYGRRKYKVAGIIIAFLTPIITALALAWLTLISVSALIWLVFIYLFFSFKLAFFHSITWS